MPLDAREQYLLELTNRARLDPLAEAARYGININQGLAAGTITAAPKEVLAPNEQLSTAAEGHSQWMIANDLFQHAGPGGNNAGDRIEDAGYTLTGDWYWGENLAWRGTTGTVNLTTAISQHHQDLFLSASHRINTLSENFSEVGIAQVQGVFTFEGTNYNASMTTLNFATTGTNVFVTGVAYTDTDGDGFYSIGEGRSGVTYQISGAGITTTSTTTSAAGGYSVAAPAGGAATVTITHGANTTVVNVDRDAGNIKLDLVGNTLLRTSGDITLVSGPITEVEALGATNISVTGNGNANILTGGTGANTLNGAGGNDTINGGAGNDTLNGGIGTDSLTGGAGNDTYVVDSLLDTVVENLNEGTDTVRSSITYTLGANLENLVLIGSGVIDGTGNSLGNSLTGNDAANALNGLGGNDTLLGAGGNDTLDGGTGNDSMAGGTGDDTYVIDSLSDVLTEALNEGTDTVRSAVSYVLGANFENLILTGSGAIDGNGNSLNNTITGNGAANTLRGLGGNDTLLGAGGNDTLDGGTGNDSMAGGTGDDSYTVDSLSDTVTEAFNEGVDTVTSSVSHTLGNNVENLTLIGSVGLMGNGNDLDNSIIGTAYDDTLDGGEGHDRIWARGANDLVVGGDGFDWIWGEGGNDTLLGGHGNDKLHGDDGDDSLEGSYGNDNLFGGAGNDVLRGHADNDLLRAGIGEDRLYGGGGDDTVEGQSGNDLVLGEDGNDRLFGGVGFDTIHGGLGNDSIEGGDWSDSLTGSEGIDRLWGGSGNDTLLGGADGDSLYGGIGADQLEGGDANDRLFGGLDNDRLMGDAGNDQLFGDSGNDTLLGGMGNDTLNGGAGSDRFVFGSNGGADKITDFHSDEGDRVVMDRAAFEGTPSLAWVLENAVSYDPEGATITTADGSTMLLEGVTALTTSDLAWM